MPRRGESIYKRKDGRWEARYIHHYEDGKAKNRYIYANTYTEVKMKRFEERKNLTETTESTVKINANFAELFDLWLNEIKYKVKESTYARYYIVLQNYIRPYFDNCPIFKLDSKEANNFIQKLLQTGGKSNSPLSPKTVTDISTILKQIMRFGKSCGYPCQELGTLKVTKKNNSKLNVLATADKEIIENKLLSSHDRVSLGILLTLYTGMRIGELCGLKHDDIDLINGTVTINRTVERIKNLDSTSPKKTKVIIATPKTQSSQRIIPLPNFIIEYLSKFESGSNTYVLTGIERNTEPHQFYLRYKSFLRKMKIEEYTFHSLRHTFATNCIEKGFDTKSLSEILGHSNVSTTLSIYVHPTIEQKKRLMERLTPNVYLSSKK